MTKLDTARLDNVMDRLQVGFDRCIPIDRDADLLAIPGEPGGDSGIFGAGPTERDVRGEYDSGDRLVTVGPEEPEATLDILQGGRQAGLEPSTLPALGARKTWRPRQWVRRDHADLRSS